MTGAEVARPSAPTPARSRASCAGSRSRTSSSEQDGRFALTPVGEAWRRWRARCASAAQVYYARRGGPARRGEHGGTAFERTYGAPFFDHLAAHPEQEAAFQASMAGRSEQEAGDVVAAYDFTGLGEPGRRRRRPRRPAGGDPRRRAAHRGHAGRPRRSGRGRREHVAPRCVEGDFFDVASRRARTPTCSRASCTTGTTRTRCASSPSAAPRCPPHGRLLVVDAILPERAKDAPVRDPHGPPHAAAARRARAHRGRVPRAAGRARASRSGASSRPARPRG